MTRRLRTIRFCASVFIATAYAPAMAADPQQPEAGLIQMLNTPCMLAKYGQGQPCQLPALPDGTDATQQAVVRVSRAQFYIDTEDLRTAFLEADEALKLNPADVDIRHLVARLAMSIGEDTRAEREIKIALQKRPDDASLQATNAARLLDRRQDKAEALRAFDQILSTHPDHRFSRESRAGLLLALGRPREAVADLDILLAGDHRDAKLLAQRGTANLAAGNPRQAVADITEALKDIPGGYYLLIERAAANEILGDDDAALRDYDTLLGPIGGQPNYAIGGNELAKFRMQRALVSVRLKRFGDAAAEAIAALNVGGRRSLLKAQIFLRQNGFPEIPLDGQSSENLRTAMRACMGLNSCFEKISGSL
jgi:Tfp pilus assembly protein PilF